MSDKIKKDKSEPVPTAERTGRKPGRKPKEQHVVGVYVKTFNRKKVDGTPYLYTVPFLYLSYPITDAKTGRKKWIQESSGVKTKTEAEAVLREKLAHVIVGKKIPFSAKSDPTIESYIDEVYLKDSKVLKQGGIVEKKRVLNNIKALLGHIKLNKITAEDVDNYFEIKQEKRANDDKPPLTQATINNHISTIKRVINYAFEKGQAGQFPYLQMKRVKKADPNNERLTCLPEEKIPLLVKECQQHSTLLRQIVEFALYTGIRRGRILRLEWSMIKFRENNKDEIDIPEDKNGLAFKAPLGEDAVKVLKERLELKQEDNPYVFFYPNGERCSDPSEGYEDAVERAGITDFTFHDLRHTFISYLVRAGEPLAFVQKLAGHKRIQQTIKYANVDFASTRQTLKSLPYKKD